MNMSDGYQYVYYNTPTHELNTFKFTFHSFLKSIDWCRSGAFLFLTG